MNRTLWIAAAFVPLLGLPAPGQNWPQFRGPESLGVSSEKGLPLRWSSGENVRWKTELPGPGHSSPIVWNGRIFLTAFEPGVGSRLLSMISSPRGNLALICVDAGDGRILWSRQVPASSIEEVHGTNSPASPTPVTDGRHVYFYLGSYGVLCYDFAGNRIWEHRLGPLPNEWGSASSPVLFEDKVLLNCDTDGEDFLLALDRKTGREIWKTSRTPSTRSWPTPFIWNTPAGPEIVVSGSKRVVAYEPKNGQELWTVDGLTQWVCPTPVYGHGLLYVVSGGPGGNVFLAIRPGGRGNISDTHVAWRFNRGAPYTPSPVLLGDYLYAVQSGGVMTCLNAKSGQLIYQKRLPAPGDYYASPIASEGKIYTLSEDGDSCVVEEGPAFRILATNSLGERCMASPAVHRGQIFIRSDAHLFCIGAPSE
jgi:outer membrane protein assembly factor BamB